MGGQLSWRKRRWSANGIVGSVLHRRSKQVKKQKKDIKAHRVTAKWWWWEIYKHIKNAVQVSGDIGSEHYNPTHPSSLNNETSQTEFGQQRRSGKLHAYLFLNQLLKAFFLIPDAILFKFVLFLKNSTRLWRTNGRTDRRMDGTTDGWTERQTDTPSYRDTRMHLKRRKEQRFCFSHHCLLITVKPRYSAPAFNEIPPIRA